MSNLRLISTVFCLSIVPFLFGCSASKDITEAQTQLQGIHDVREVEVDSLSPVLADYRKNEEDEVLYRLEYGMLYHYQQDWDSSATHFQHANRTIERYYGKDISKNLQSLLINDLQLPYKGEPYESIYLSTFNCLNYLHQGDIQGGLVEVRKINHKLQLLNDRYKGLANSLMHNKGDDEQDMSGARKAVKKVDKKLTDIDLLSDESEQPVEIQQNSALGRFLAMVLYAKTGSPSDARIELENLRTALDDQGETEYLSTFSSENPPQTLASSSTGPSSSTSEAAADSAPAPQVEGQRPPPAAYSTLVTPFRSLFPNEDAAQSSWFFSPPEGTPDSSPVDLPAERQLTSPTAYNTLLVSFSGNPPRKRERSFQFNFYIDNEEIQLNFAVPVLEKPGTEVDRVRARIAGKTIPVPMIENMQSVAESMFNKTRTLVYTRAIMRSFLKAGATEGAEEIAENEMGFFAGWLTEQAGEAMSKGLAQADTRAWQTMPGFAYATVAEVPPGEHKVTFEYLSSDGTVLQTRTRKISVNGNRDLALAESLYLD